MPYFTLPVNERNRAIAEALRSLHSHVKTMLHEDRILISFDGGLDVSILDFPSHLIPDDDAWRAFVGEVRSTLSGAKIRKYTRLNINIAPLKERKLNVRLTEDEEKLIKKAAEICRMSLSDFVRTAMIKVANEVFEEEALRRKEEEWKQERKMDRQTYVA